jgi:hypothetical protein
MKVLNKGGWLGGYNTTKSFYVSKQTQTPWKEDLDHTTKTITEDRPNQVTRPNFTNPTRVPTLMWWSMSLMTVSTAIITILHSGEVVYILHESRSSFIAGYPLYRWVPLHTSGVHARTSLQGCSMVFPSLQHPRWGFTGGVSPDHQGPPLTPCGYQEYPLPYPLIPNQTDRKRVHSIRTTDWYAKLGSTTYYTRPYPYRLMVVLFSCVVAPWTDR